MVQNASPSTGSTNSTTSSARSSPHALSFRQRKLFDLGSTMPQRRVTVANYWGNQSQYYESERGRIHGIWIRVGDRSRRGHHSRFCGRDRGTHQALSRRQRLGSRRFSARYRQRRPFRGLRRVVAGGPTQKERSDSQQDPHSYRDARSHPVPSDCHHDAERVPGDTPCPAWDATTGRQLWRVHPQAIWLGIQPLRATSSRSTGSRSKQPARRNSSASASADRTAIKQSRQPAGVAPYPPRRITAVDAESLNHRPPDPQGNLGPGPGVTSSPDLEGPAADGFRLDRPSQRLIRLDSQRRPLWSAPIPIVSEQSIVTTMIAENVVYVTADGQRDPHLLR